MNGRARRGIFNDSQNKERCYHKVTDDGTYLLFLEGPFETDDGIVHGTICLTYDEAVSISKEDHVEYFVGGFTDTQLRNINYFISMFDLEKEKRKAAKYTEPVDLSNIKYRPRNVVSIDPEKEKLDVSRVSKQYIDTEPVSTTETNAFIRNQSGKFLHSPDINTPAVIKQDTGEQSFYDMGRLYRKILPDGEVVDYSKATGRRIK
jgi:hypothetical protein